MSIDQKERPFFYPTIEIRIPSGLYINSVLMSLSFSRPDLDLRVKNHESQNKALAALAIGKSIEFYAPNAIKGDSISFQFSGIKTVPDKPGAATVVAKSYLFSFDGVKWVQWENNIGWNLANYLR